jgi:hypothetical protein
LLGSKISADVTDLLHASFGGIVAQHYGELENIDSNMDMDLRSLPSRQAFVLAGGIAGKCYSAAARTNQVRAAGSLTVTGIVWDAGVGNISRKGATMALKIGEADCHQNQVQSSFQ